MFCTFSYSNECQLLKSNEVLYIMNWNYTIFSDVADTRNDYNYGNISHEFHSVCINRSEQTTSSQIDDNETIQDVKSIQISKTTQWQMTNGCCIYNASESVWIPNARDE